MELNPIRFGSCAKKGAFFLASPALWLLSFFFSLATAAQTPNARISLSLQNAPLEQALKEIRKQSGYRFVYTREQLKKASPVTLNLTSAPLNQVLEACLKDQPFTYVLEGKFIALRDRVERPELVDRPQAVSGSVRDDEGRPLGGITVMVERTRNATATDDEGQFDLEGVEETDVLVFSAVGYRQQEVAVLGRSYLVVRLSIAIREMDETLVIAYGTTTRRLSTGNVSKVSAKEIGEQPVGNVLGALQGRVPGMVVTQGSGIPGTAFNLEVRGRSALDLSLSRNDPLILIDGLPFEAGNLPANLLMSAANNPVSASEGGLSALNSISPTDIESIEVLKDADATAIYGSRGANGVIIITTKKGKPGKTQLTTGVYTGFSWAPRLPRMLDTKAYVQMRREALANDGLVPDANNAPDLVVWDTSRYTDFRKLLTGHTAHSTDASLQLSGGNSLTSFLLGANYRRETTVFPGNFADQRSSVNLNLNHHSLNKKLELTLSTLFSNDNNRLLSLDISRYLQLPPNLLLHNSTGKLAWEEDGVAFTSLDAVNPLAQLNEKYTSLNQNLSSSLNLRYLLGGGLSLQLTTGYNLFTTDETSKHPRASLPPSATDLPSASFATSQTRNWMVEPQLSYTHSLLKGKLSVLLGSSLQEKIYKANTLLGTNYSNDLLLGSIAAAGRIDAENFYRQYRYQAGFGRIGYNYNNKYLVNLSGRRDGSSRFGPGKQFANFGAVGVAWIFSNEKFVGKHLKFLSFGKIRGSIGVTGNDQVGDYKFYDLWKNTSYTYQGVAGLFPTGLFNADYTWEKNRKQEAALELGFWQDRILVSAAYYRQRSSNQLINYNLPIQAGFPTLVRNLPALVQNTGLELVLRTHNIRSKNFSWHSILTMTLPKNRLLAFPGLEGSPYANTLVVGAPLSVIHRLRYLGVDPQTGVYQFEDLNQDGKLSSLDYQVLGNRDPKLYGGLQNQLSYKGVQLSFFIQFVRQLGTGYLANLYATVPGTVYNQPKEVLNRWQQPGDEAEFQKYSTQLTGAANLASTRLPVSDGIYEDASFIRLKTLSLSYALPGKWLTKRRIEEGKLFLSAQNLLTLTRYKGADPENQRFFQVPPLRTIAGGIQLKIF